MAHVIFQNELIPLYKSITSFTSRKDEQVNFFWETGWSEAVWQQGFSFGLQNTHIVQVNGICNGTTNRTLSWWFVQWQGMIKVDRLYITAMVAYYSKQCYLREINTFLFSGTNYQEYMENQYISQSVKCPFLALTFVQELHCQSLSCCLMPSNDLCASASSIRGLGGTAEWVVHKSYGFFQTQEWI